MASHSGGKRLFLLSLDGLSSRQLKLISSRVSWFGELLAAGNLTTLDTRPLTSPQPAWAEILTGRRWYEVGCPGYARPGSQLNDLEIVTESCFGQQFEWLEPGEEACQLVVNMPILMSKPGRVWLSDGASPTQTIVSPRELAGSPPFCNYRARPFASTTAALVDQRQSILTCLEVERQRLACVLDLVKHQRWSTCFFRISVFDLLAHLIGHDFLFCEELSIWPDLSKFLSDLDEMMLAIKEETSSAQVFVVSTFSHVRCHARLNLNQLLLRGGFCHLVDPAKRDEPESARRTMAALAVASNEALPQQARPMVSKTDNFDLARTLAGSPVQGAIYVNRRDRFAGGTVNESEVSGLLDRLEGYIRAALEEDLGDSFHLWRCPNHGQGTPDLMVYAKGVELHNFAEPLAVDRHNRPRSTHSAEGFVCLPGTLDRMPPVIESWQLHAALRDALQ